MADAYLPLRMAMLSDTGRVRVRNEDQVYCDASRGIALLADGMGGHAGGALASRLAVAAWLAEVEDRPPGTIDETCMRAAVAAANQVVFDTACQDVLLRSMGTTLVAVCFRTDGQMIACHVGDSRLYRLRGESLECLTRDHSVLREQCDAGMIEAESDGAPALRGLLTRAVGVDVQVQPDLIVTQVCAEDVFLLCSDGLTDMLPDREIFHVLDTLGANPRLAAEHLVDLANDQGGTDNVSVVVVSLRSGGLPVSVIA
ncbi:MAG TPA: protein phosphatase 2C domain-containing protein [Zoogloea sp.]|uniref:PP2C family protein-serine/threonine phosphatase n=1 Tax=Zoogloea sp. TaxID=49181 RepID=UPI002B62FB62|nr:protein phosphatase 2C domain-containing protein [Zoogloea sp.]HMV18587.1 protein phosphatase 2C domain-containing protein [Rhodocyclaceae bacterium]HMV64537.1 protein phosphatase 2C domain-containing protein [Rhodocyclaceae bacterium]HMW53249.1 protein phosphatase 2C domain-containing protein [Rhodocyclaceae bacterium]HMY49932.1 protein phosphatase 2C domain-containing protein [Rhodocyclaceae bacterium]HMZ76529.1 protein phosphatase 2C domain-containing protein [Rhodocyclaceae bacterium]